MESHGLESFYRASRHSNRLLVANLIISDSVIAYFHSDKIACFHLPTKADANMKYFILNRERGYVKRGVPVDIIDIS